MENSQNTQQPQQASFNPVEDFNLGLFIYIVNKTVVWLVFIVIISVTFSIIYLRYAPRIYESSTMLMLKTQKTAQILGEEKILVEQDELEVSREIQLLKSKLIIERLVDKLPLQIGYYKEGKTKFIFSELYTTSPFEVEGKLYNEEIVNTPIYIKILNPHKIYMGFSFYGKEYEYNKDTGQIFSNPYFSVTIHLDRQLNEEDFSGIYYFKFLNRKDVVNEISDKLAVLPLDPKTKTVQLNYKDRNPLRAKEVVSTIANEFIDYDIEKKGKG